MRKILIVALAAYYLVCEWRSFREAERRNPWRKIVPDYDPPGWADDLLVDSLGYG